MEVSDESLIHRIVAGGTAMNHACEVIYRREKTRIITVVIGKGLSQDKAKEIYNDAFRIFVLVVREGKFRGQGKNPIGAFLYGTTKRLTLRLWAEQRRNYPLEKLASMYAEETSEAGMVQAEVVQWTQWLVRQLPARDQELIRMRFEMKMKFEDIADRLNLKNEQVARNLFQRILVKLRYIIHENPDEWDLLFD